MTQEFIANVLGMGREVMREAEVKLQRLGLIQYPQGDPQHVLGQSIA